MNEPAKTADPNAPAVSTKSWSEIEKLYPDYHFAREQASLQRAYAAEVQAKAEASAATATAAHREFAKAYRAGQLRIDINRKLAWDMANGRQMPWGMQFAHHFWSWVWMLSVPGSFALMYFYKWWVGLLVLLFLPGIILKANRTAVMQDIITLALDDEQFYSEAIGSGLICVGPPK